ncbi:inter-alpha-trypsin inhibitor heavy chain H4-like isoform X2 [Liolophura sinensis]|uniref:inter-alpha-trypsin inhibitor heavy chain H4-like isoform X2 n=1 Tax=Liolophura sinensis TaxID=3198878 RepID=UPI0031586404
MAGYQILLPIGVFIISICTAKEADFSVEKLHVNSIITHRFATTHVTSVLVNLGYSPKEAIFDIRLPKGAFISNFSMTIEDKVYVGYIEEKEAAQKTYDAAVERGQSAGHIRARESNKFTASVNVAAAMSVTFELTYQELLERRLGLYEHVIYIDPGQPVADMKVDVYIVESRVITDLSVPPISNDLITDVIIDDTNEYARIDILSESSAHIAFSPTPEEQRHFSEQGVSGQFIVNYDVEHEMDGVGEILVVDGYFVHFFAAGWLEPLSKRLMFVMDTSGSMSGIKIRQMKQALVTILNELSPDDEFGILTFSSGVQKWKGGEILPASLQNIEQAKLHAETLIASGGTNINAALLLGLDLLSGDSDKSNMLIFLTDGQATSGVTSSTKILQNIKTSNDGVSIFSLAFGSGADFSLLQQISGQNNGLARKIYEDADATLQLTGFYDEISSPLLSELKITYLGDVDNSSLTENTLHCLFDGAEMVVAGRLSLDNNSNSVPTIDINIEGNLVDSTLVIDQTFNMTDITLEDIPTASAEDIQEFTHRLWVYLTIKQLVATTQQASDPQKVQEAKNKAKELALKYNFVTPFTSMVVTKPGDGDEEDKEVMGGRRQHDEDDVFYEDYDYQPMPIQPPQYGGYLPGLPGFPGLSGPSGLRPDMVPKMVTMRGFPKYTTTRPAFNIWARRTTTTAATTTTTAPKRRLYVTTTLPPKVSKGYLPAINVRLNDQQSPGVAMNVCFDIPLTASKPEYTILRTGETDVSGKVSRAYTNGKKFAQIDIKTPNITVKITTRTLRFEGKKTIAWWQLKKVNISQGEVTASGGLKLDLGGDLYVTVNVYGIQSRRSRVKPFLAVSVNSANWAYVQPTGLVGRILKLKEPRVKGNQLMYRKPVQKSVPVQEYTLLENDICNRITDSNTVTHLLQL